MVSWKITFWYKVMALLLVLILIVPILAACGGDNGEKTPTPSATTPVATTPVKTTPAATTPAPTVSKEPIKIGALNSYSGPIAMAGVLSDQAVAVVQNQLKKMGGILGGRSIEFVKADDGGTAGGTVAGYTKLALQNKVSAVVWGGAMSALINAASDTAEETKVPLFDIGNSPEDVSSRPYTILATQPSRVAVVGQVADFTLSKLKPQTVGLMVDDSTEQHQSAQLYRQKLQAAGVKIVYEEFISAGTSDFSSYLTKMKYANPDVFIADLASDAAMATILKQIAELGGWGNTKFLGAEASSSGLALKMKGAEGTYHWLLWSPGLPYPGSKEFEQAWMEVQGKVPTPTNVFHYTCIWTAIKAIELAGSDDPAKIAQAARSGNLHWDAPGGPMTINPDGTNTSAGTIMQFKDGKLVLAE
ncbi:MAG: ABC transporter substrate-binding protein [Dehalococcoidia bacterium]